MAHDIGDTVPLLLTVTRPDGTPFDPASITVAVTRPDGTNAATGPVQNPEIGEYQSSVDTDAAGTWRVVWTSTTPGNIEHHSFVVQPNPPARSEPLATPDDLVALLGRDLDATEAALAPGALRSASARVRSYCRQQFTRTEDDPVTLRPVGKWLRLPQAPIEAVASVTAVGSNQIPDTVITGWHFDGIDRIDITGALNTETFVSLPAVLDELDWAAWSYRVVYTHGYLTIPDIVVDVVAGAALRSVVSPTDQSGLTQVTIGQYTEQHQQARGSAGRAVYLAKADKEALVDAGFRRRATTIQLAL